MMNSSVTLLSGGMATDCGDSKVGAFILNDFQTFEISEFEKVGGPTTQDS